MKKKTKVLVIMIVVLKSPKNLLVWDSKKWFVDTTLFKILTLRRENGKEKKADFLK